MLVIKIRNILKPLFHIIVEPHVKYVVKKTQEDFLQYKDMYKGKRCFIVANGPSLSKNDLDMLYINKEITFGLNRIYVMFDRTEWRPNFYLSQDPSIIRSCRKEMMESLRNIPKFIKPPGEPWINVKGAIYFNLDYSYGKKRIRPAFGIGKKGMFVDGRTVTYTAIQLAAYMGFEDIYLLGCDCNYSKGNKIIDINSYADERMYNPKKVGMNPDMQYNFMAYKSAKEYADSNAVNIYNATRGGMLEIFERVDFESLF